jgi:hypothetical protein
VKLNYSRPGYNGPTLTLFSGTLVLSGRDSLMLVLEVGRSPDTLRAQYTMHGDTLDVAADAQRSGYSRIVGPVIHQPNGEITVPAAQYRSLSSGFTTIPLNLTFGTP